MRKPDILFYVAFDDLLAAPFYYSLVVSVNVFALSSPFLLFTILKLISHVRRELFQLTSMETSRFYEFYPNVKLLFDPLSYETRSFFSLI